MHPHDVHQEKRAIEKDEREEEMDDAQPLVHHPAEHLGKPIINRPEIANMLPPKST